MCTPMDSEVFLAATGAHGALELLVGVNGFTHVDPGRGPVKALAPATSTEHNTADFIALAPGGGKVGCTAVLCKLPRGGMRGSR